MIYAIQLDSNDEIISGHHRAILRITKGFFMNSTTSNIAFKGNDRLLFGIILGVIAFGCLPKQLSISHPT